MSWTATLQETPANRVRRHRSGKQERLPQITRIDAGSGRLAAQFRERPGGMNKMLKAQGSSPFQSCGRSYNNDPIGGLEAMGAVGNFLQDPI